MRRVIGDSRQRLKKLAVKNRDIQGEHSRVVLKQLEYMNSDCANEWSPSKRGFATDSKFCGIEPYQAQGDPKTNKCIFNSREIFEYVRKEGIGSCSFSESAHENCVGIAKCTSSHLVEPSM